MRAVLATGPFAELAAQLRDFGLCPIPCGGEDGKRPLLAFGRIRGLPSARTVAGLAARPEFAAASIGILPDRSGLVVVDLDDPALADPVEAALGVTPLVVGTPSGGLHLYYATAGGPVSSRNLRSDLGLAIDIKAKGGFVVVPPSRRETGSYRFIRGDWRALPALPPFPADALDRLATLAGGRACNGHAARPPANLSSGWEPIPEGSRNDAMFRAALRLAPDVAREADLLAALEDVNASRCTPRLDHDELARIAASAWRYETEGRNFARRGGFTCSNAARDAIGDPDGFWLLAHLRQFHPEPGAIFAVAARAMAEAGTVPGLGEKRIRKATERLVEAGFLVRLHAGGTGRGDAAQYRFGLDPRLVTT
jgi:hypothetical protein